MNAIRQIFIIFTLLIPMVASAQRPGSVGYNTTVLPAHGLGDTKAPDGRMRWGAYARGDDRTLGFTVDGRTENEARALAVANCEARGSTNCVALEMFFNSCIAVAASPNDRVAQMSSKGPRWVRRHALKECGSDRKIIYEGCAFP